MKREGGGLDYGGDLTHPELALRLIRPSVRVASPLGEEGISGKSPPRRGARRVGWVDLRNNSKN
jgi:hypothetical protein